jgi:UDP-3-O-[3-hydroxymyristoyl] glucosamine N-acyltransferase
MTSTKIMFTSDIHGSEPVFRKFSSECIGDNFQSGHNILIRENTKIGNDVLIGTNTTVDGNCEIGSRVRAQTNVYITAYTIIEDDVFWVPVQ